MSNKNTITANKKSGLFRRISSHLWENSGMLLIYIILFIFLSIFVPYFFTWRNMVALALSISMLGMVSCTMLFCLASGDFDLSVSSIVAFSGVVAAVVINGTNSVSLGIVLGILAGGFFGMANGVVIAKLHINALITTLAMTQIVRGFAYIVSGGQAISISNSGFFGLGNNIIIGIPSPIWITVFSFAVFAILINNTSFGKNTLAIGGNIEAARLAGINVDRIKVLIFSLQGLMAGFAGVILASRMTSGQPNAAQGFELNVISSCVLGGVSLNGGVAPIQGAIIGVLIMGTVQDAMSLLNIPTFYQYVVRGMILLIAVIVDQIKQDRMKKAS